MTIRLSNLDRLIAEGASPGAIQQLYTHYGVPIWLGVIVASYVIGLNIDKKLKRPRKRSLTLIDIRGEAEKLSPETHK